MGGVQRRSSGLHRCDEDAPVNRGVLSITGEDQRFCHQYRLPLAEASVVQNRQIIVAAAVRSAAPNAPQGQLDPPRRTCPGIDTSGSASAEESSMTSAQDQNVRSDLLTEGQDAAGGLTPGLNPRKAAAARLPN